MAIALLVKQGVRETVRELRPDVRISEDFIVTLTRKIHEDLRRAADRAHANGRTTLLPQDI